MGPGGPRVLPPPGEGESPIPAMDLPRRGVAPVEVDAAAVAAGGTGPVVAGGVVLVGGSPEGPLRCGRGGRADTILGRGGRSLVVGKVVGWSAWWLVLQSHALVLFVHRVSGPVG